MRLLRELASPSESAAVVHAPRYREGDVERLRELGLASRSGQLRLTGIGRLLARRVMEEAHLPTTVIQGVANSQIAVGNSEIIGSVTVTEQEFDAARVLTLIEELGDEIAKLGLTGDIAAELMSDLETIKTQSRSPRPKRPIISACIENVRTVLQGVAGNAAFFGILELLKRLVG
jgi:hypothetical protein